MGNYEHISIPVAWLSDKTYDDIDLYQEEADRDEELLTYNSGYDEYQHTRNYHWNSADEWLCNSEDEFLERVKLAKLERIT